MAQGPAAMKFTCNPFGTPAESAVAVIVGASVMVTELGTEPKVIVWSFFSTAGGEAGLWRCVEVPGSGTRVVVIVYTTVCAARSGFVSKNSVAGGLPFTPLTLPIAIGGAPSELRYTV
jgi:hypothetical protein